MFTTRLAVRSRAQKVRFGFSMVAVVNFPFFTRLQFHYSLLVIVPERASAACMETSLTSEDFFWFTFFFSFEACKSESQIPLRVQIEQVK